MNDLVENVVSNYGLKKTHARTLVRGLFDSIANSSSKVTVTGFGSFKTDGEGAMTFSPATALRGISKTTARTSTRAVKTNAKATRTTTAKRVSRKSTASKAKSRRS